MRAPAWHDLLRPSLRIAALIATLALALVGAYAPWCPGLDVRDGRHDLGRNAIWLQHGWLESDDWFARHGTSDRIADFRSPGSGYHVPEVENLASGLLGVHAELARFERVPAHYPGVGLYCEWETDPGEWRLLRERFLRGR